MGCFLHAIIKHDTTTCRKSCAADTSAEWLQCNSMHEAFLVDSILKSKDKLANFRTQMLIGVQMWQSNVCEPVWRLLQRFRVVPCREKVANWLSEQPKQQLMQHSVKIFSFDNCDMKKHVTHVRSDHRTEMIHLIAGYVVDTKEEECVHTSQMWKENNLGVFGNWVQASNDKVNRFANFAVLDITNMEEEQDFKCVYTAQSIPLTKTTSTILPPWMGLRTNNYQHIQQVLDDYHHQYMAKLRASYAFVQGDEQVFTLVWHLKVSQKDKYSWIIPVVADWHFCWHILQAIFRLYGRFILLPLSRVLGYIDLDLTCKNFHYAEDFIQLVTLAIRVWVKKALQVSGLQEATQLLERYHTNSQAYEVLYFFIYYLCPYWITRAAMKVGDSRKVNHCTTKFNYTYSRKIAKNRESLMPVMHSSLITQL